MRCVQMPVGYDQIPELASIAKLDSSYHEMLDGWWIIFRNNNFFFYLSFSGIGLVVAIRDVKKTLSAINPVLKEGGRKSSCYQRAGVVQVGELCSAD